MARKTRREVLQVERLFDDGTHPVIVERLFGVEALEPERPAPLERTPECAGPLTMPAGPPGGPSEGLRPR
jgi:hypothetical protein